MERVLVLGGTGFLGRHVMRKLGASGWAEPLAASRSCGSAAVPWTFCDAADPRSLDTILQGQDLVVNCLAGSGAQMVDGTRNLLEAASRQNIRRVVHISSMAVYAPVSGLVDEAAPLLEDGNAYSSAKVECESLMARYAGQGVETVVLRPSCIYGQGSTAWTQRIGRLLRAGRLGDLGPAGRGACNLIHVEDAADAVLSALRVPDAAGEAFNLSSPEIPSWNEYLARFAAALGLARPRRISSAAMALETWLMAPLLVILRRLGVKLRRDPISPGLLQGMSRQMRLSHSKADAVLRFSRTSLDDGLRDAANWFRTVE